MEEIYEQCKACGVAGAAIDILKKFNTTPAMFLKTLDDNFLSQMGIDLENKIKILTAKAIINENDQLNQPSTSAAALQVEFFEDAVDPDPAINEEFKEFVTNNECCEAIRHKLVSHEPLLSTEHTSVVKAGVKFLVGKYGLYPRADQQKEVACLFATNFGWIKKPLFRTEEDVARAYFDVSNKKNHVGYIPDRLRTIRRKVPKKNMKRKTPEETGSDNELIVKRLKWTAPIETNRSTITFDLKESFTERRAFLERNEIPAVLDRYERLLDYNGDMIIAEFALLEKGICDGLRAAKNFFIELMTDGTFEEVDRDFTKCLAKIYKDTKLRNTKKEGENIESFTNKFGYPPTLLQKYDANQDPELLATANVFNLKQPYIMSVGATYFLVIENRPVNLGEDAEKSFDVFYKTFYVFNIEFAVSLKPFFSFFDSFVYKIPGARQYSKVVEFIAKYNKN